ncbi:MAG: hypothetical protein KGJ80_21910, partial [Chloroflexota bacterium]|nr:hypothetical protein [Chloroflexota bacterium]
WRTPRTRLPLPRGTATTALGLAAGPKPGSALTTVLPESNARPAGLLGSICAGNPGINNLGKEDIDPDQQIVSSSDPRSSNAASHP